MSEPAFTRIADTQPAFPIRGAVADYQFGGMTLRDYFAGQALIGCFNFWVQVHAKGASIGDPDQDAITRLAYEYADAMLKARQS